MRRSLLVAQLRLSRSPRRPRPRCRRRARSCPDARSAGSPSGSPRAPCAPRSGTFYGACRDCGRKTWYLTYRPFGRQGLAVEFSRGRVSGVYTLWRPARWHATAQARSRRTGARRASARGREQHRRLSRRLRGAGPRLRTRPHRLLPLRRQALGIRPLPSRRQPLQMSIELEDIERAAAATRRRRAPHAGRHLAHARRAGRRAGPHQGRVLPARRRLQVPRRVQPDLVTRRGRAAPRRHRLLLREPRPGGRHRGARCSARGRRSSCPRTRRRRSSTRRAATAPRSCRTTAGPRAARRSACAWRTSEGSSS